jgi:hypothetical protein
VTAMTEEILVKRTCLDCATTVLLPQPGDDTSSGFGLSMYFNRGPVRWAATRVTGWQPGGIQGRRQPGS